MKVGVPKETASGERRVALVPDSVKRLAEAGVEVVVESGAGTAAGFLDTAYEESGAMIAGDAFSGADAVAKVQQPSDDEVGKLSDGQILVAFLQAFIFVMLTMLYISGAIEEAEHHGGEHHPAHH